MKKTWILLLSVVLLVGMTATAFAAAQNPMQSGDPGGKLLEEILKNVNNNKPPQNAAPSTSGSSGSGSPSSSNPGGSGSSSGGTGEYVPENSGSSGSGSSGAPESSGSSGSSSSGGTMALDWYNVGFDLINANKNITIYDVNTGITWSARYINGKNHADIIPASQADAVKINEGKITGSYVRRPVIVTIAGTKYAGSMYAVGHGETSYASYFKGVMCIHFTGSQTHGSQKVDSDHQKAIQDALNSGN